jgi:hypothetical protein
MFEADHTNVSPVCLRTAMNVESLPSASQLSLSISSLCILCRPVCVCVFAYCYAASYARPYALCVSLARQECVAGCFGVEKAKQSTTQVRPHMRNVSVQSTT